MTNPHDQNWRHVYPTPSSLTDVTFTPFQMNGDIHLFFDGPLPNPGDAVEMVCYEASDRELKFRWRVVQRGEHE